MPSRSSTALLFAEIFAHLGAGIPDGEDDVPSFRCSFDGDVPIRVDYDDEDELVWLTTPLVIESPAPLHSWLPALLRLNYAGAAQGLSRSIDLDTGAVFLQSRLEGTVVRFADFQAAVAVHLEAVALTRQQIVAPATDSSDPGAAQRGSAADGQPRHGPIMWA